MKMSHLLSSVTDSVCPSKDVDGTSGSFFAAKNDSSYCEGAQTSIVN